MSALESGGRARKISPWPRMRCRNEHDLRPRCADRLLLIQRGGRTTYFGPVGESSSALIGYLKSVPGTPDLTPGFNPATWMLEVTGGSMATMVEVRMMVDPHARASVRSGGQRRRRAQRIAAANTGVRKHA